MNNYIVKDMYVAAFLQANGYSFTHTTENNRVYFHFPIECKQLVNDLISKPGINEKNVNANTLISCIKGLKSFVKNI